MWGPGGSHVPSEHQVVSRSLVGWHQRQEGRLWYWARSDHPWHRHGSNHILLPQQPWSATIHIPHRCCKINHTQNLRAIQNFYPVGTSKLIEVYNGYMDSATKSAISSKSHILPVCYHLPSDGTWDNRLQQRDPSSNNSWRDQAHQASRSIQLNSPPWHHTCSPNLAKLADKMEGDTIMSSFENLSTREEASTAGMVALPLEKQIQDIYKSGHQSPL